MFQGRVGTISYWLFASLCKNLHGAGVYTSPHEIGTVPVKRVDLIFLGRKLAHFAVKKFVRFRRLRKNAR